MNCFVRIFDFFLLILHTPLVSVKHKTLASILLLQGKMPFELELISILRIFGMEEGKEGRVYCEILP